MCLVPESPVDGENLVQSSAGLRQVEGPDEVQVPMPCSTTNKTLTGRNGLSKLMQEGITMTSLTGKTVVKGSLELAALSSWFSSTANSNLTKISRFKASLSPDAA